MTIDAKFLRLRGTGCYVR